MFSAGILLVQLLQASVTEASLWPFKNSHSQLQGHTIHASQTPKPVECFTGANLAQVY